MSYRELTYALLLGAVLMAPQAWADMAVIANAAYPVDSASKDEIRKLYLGKAKQLSGNKAVPVDQDKESDTTAVFYQSIVGKTASQVRAYWSKLIFTGKGRPPKQVGNDSEVVEAVSVDPVLVGYVSTSAINDSVKVLMTVQEGAGD